jgi:hypothetical protein
MLARVAVLGLGGLGGRSGPDQPHRPFSRPWDRAGLLDQLARVTSKAWVQSPVPAGVRRRA